MVDLKRYENTFWGLGIIVAAIGTYLVCLFDGSAVTVPDVNVLFTAILIGAAKMRSASVAETKEIKQEVAKNTEATVQLSHASTPTARAVASHGSYSDPVVQPDGTIRRMPPDLTSRADLYPPMS